MKRMGHLIGVATELGITMGLIAAALVLLGLWVGRWLDGKLGISPVATILFLLAGAAAGQLAIYRLAKRSAKLLSADSEHALTVRQAAGTLGMALRTLALIALPVLIGLLLGVWLDQLLQTRVLLTLLLALGGFIAGLVGTVRLVYASRTTFDEKGKRECSDNAKDC